MEPTRRYIKKRLNSREAYNVFLAGLQATDTTDSLYQDLYCDPDQNYNTVHDHHTKLKEKHLPYKFNEYRHKKYITRHFKTNQI